jgi:flagellar hook assembly protein FlgD
VAAQIISDNDSSPGIKVVRGLQNWTATGAGIFNLQWNGLNDSGAKVSPGLYLARVMSTLGKGIGYATGWVVVNA